MSDLLKVYTCMNHDTVWPVGGASIVVAKNRKAAKELLNAALVKHGLEPSDNLELLLVSTTLPKAIILRDGDY